MEQEINLDEITDMNLLQNLVNYYVFCFKNMLTIVLFISSIKQKTLMTERQFVEEFKSCAQSKEVIIIVLIIII